MTIDGPAGTGKSTVAREVSRRLGFGFLDTGAMYRSVALAAEPDDQRRQQYQLSWLTPTRLLMRNANHLALVEESINLGLANGASGKSDYRRAAAELALVITNDAPIKSFDSRAIPQADYGLMSGFVALALGEATGNTLLGEGTFAAMLHYERAIRDYERTSTTGTGIFVPTSLRPQLFTAAICQLDTLAANPPAGWSAAARRDAPLIRATLVAHGGSRAGCTAD